MTVPDMRDDEAVRLWLYDHIINPPYPGKGRVPALRSLVREVARKVAHIAVKNLVASEPCDPINDALSAVLGPERKEGT